MQKYMLNVKATGVAIAACFFFNMHMQSMHVHDQLVLPHSNQSEMLNKGIGMYDPFKQ